MALVSGRGSALNPNARPFIPAVYRQVEDFSTEWWDLVQNSAWFRDYWMSERQGGNFEEAIDTKEDDITNLLPETFDFGYDDFPEAEFEEFVGSFDYHGGNGLRTEVKSQNGVGLDAAGTLIKNFNMLSVSPKGRGMATNHLMEQPKYNDRVVQQTSYNYGSRRIHQPR